MKCSHRYSKSLLYCCTIAIITVCVTSALPFKRNIKLSKHDAFVGLHLHRHETIVANSHINTHTRKHLFIRGGSAVPLPLPEEIAVPDGNGPYNSTNNEDSSQRDESELLSKQVEAELEAEPFIDEIAIETQAIVTEVEELPPTLIAQDSQQDEEEYKKALFKTAATVGAAALFGIGVMATRGVSSGYEFYAGYLIEQSLSIDNLFVFIMLFDYFKVPMELQNRVLSWGIWGAILLRGLMIGVGVAVLQQFRSVILVFAGILVASSINLLMENDHHDDPDASSDDNIILKLTKFIFPNTSSELHGEDFFVKNDAGKNIATPLFLCLVCVELSDFVFAVDSIPAVLGVSKDPMIVYASNIFAIMALRSLYTVVAKAISSFHYLKPAVAAVLGFVGVKMVAEYFHVEIGTGISLAVISSILGTGIGASILESKSKNKVEKNVQ